MLRNNSRKLKDIPPEVRLSLEFLDDVLEEYAAEAEEVARRPERHLEDMPVDVRHSLEVLDDILTEFEGEEMKDDIEDIDVKDPRSLDVVPPEVRKSLEMLDSVLDEVEREAKAPKRPKLRDNGTQGRRNRHEDIRHSLEVLDNVLAEFDDCLDSWDTSPTADCKRPLGSPTESRRKFPPDDNSSNGGKCSDSFPVDSQFSLNNARGGSTSHNSSSCIPEQPKVGSPPPIPKRSPTTRLSEQILSPFSFPSDDTSLDSYDSNRSDSGVHGDGLSDHAQISCLSSLKKNGDTAPRHSSAKNTFGSDNCANCGCELKRNSLAMESAEGADIPSPFQQRKQLFENKIAEELSSTPHPTGVNRSYGSSFRIRKTQTPEQLDTSSEPVSLPANLTGSGNGSASYLSNGLSSHPDDEDEVSLPSTHHAVNCTCREKIQKLRAKFSETRRLLKQNSINGLHSKPPSFVPPPPPVMNGKTSQVNSVLNSDSSVETARNPPPRTEGDSSGLLKVKDSLQDSEVDSCHSVDSSNESLQSGNHRLEDSLNSSKLNDSSRLCNRCSSSLSVHLSTTIEDLPNLLPTDALNRPHLGLSYSLEDDLSPGVKEIQHSSTPKSDASSPSLFKTKDSSLSTFSHSASSLGYVSSQSDLELNNIPTLPNKVPVSTFKSRTLPNGLDRSPFYSPVDDVFDKSHSPGQGKDHNGNRYPKLAHVSHDNLLQLRSSSTPPLPEEEKPKKKLFRFSRKDKSKKKNDDSLSLKSDLSFDEGIILKKVEALDGSTVLTDVVADTDETGSEKKRRSLWRSLVGKK